MSLFRKFTQSSCWKFKYRNSFLYKNIRNYSQVSQEGEEKEAFEKMEQERTRVLDDELKELSRVAEYTEGVRLAIENKLSSAEEQFKLALYLLRNEEEFKPKLIGHVVQKICMVLKVQNKDDDLTEFLEEAYFISLAEENPNYETVVKNISNLITHYCIKDIEKGLVFCDTVLEELTNDTIPLIHAKEIYSHIGTMYLVAGDYQKAIKYLEESLNLKPNPFTRGMVLHNLAYAYWAGYNKFIGEESGDILKNAQNFENLNKETEEFKAFQKKLLDAGKDNSKVIPYFKRAIKSFEMLYEDDPIKYPRKDKDKLTPKQFAAVTIILNEGEEKVDVSKWKQEDIAIKNPMSALSALNLGEVLFQAGYYEQALFWIKLGLEISSKSGTMPKALRGMIILSLIHQEQNRADFTEKMLIDCLEYSEPLPIYNKIICLETYSQFLASKKRVYEAEEYFNQAKILREKIPFWHERKDVLQIRDYSF